MYTDRGRKLGSKSITILKVIFHVGDAILDDFMKAGQEYGQRQMYGMVKDLYNLERSGYVKKTKRKNNQSFFHLTPKGKLKFLKYLHLEKLRKKKWDGHWRVIVFDVPEKLKKWREIIRNELKNLGFESLQESVYITPYPVTKDLEKFLTEHRLRQYCRYLTVTEIDDEREFKEKFGLK